MKTLIKTLLISLTVCTLAHADFQGHLTKNQVQALNQKIKEVSNFCKRIQSHYVVGKIEEYGNTYCKPVSCVIKGSNLSGALATQEACIYKTPRKTKFSKSSSKANPSYF